LEIPFLIGQSQDHLKVSERLHRGGTHALQKQLGFAFESIFATGERGERTGHGDQDPPHAIVLYIKNNRSGPNNDAAGQSISPKVAGF
jgi:hypothetical protein